VRALQLAHLGRVRARARARARVGVGVGVGVTLTLTLTSVRALQLAHVLAALAHHRIHHVDGHLEHLVRVRVWARGRVRIRDLVAHLGG